MNSKLKSISQFLLTALTLILAFTLLFPAQAAYAQGEDPPQDAERHGRWKNRLSRIYHHELNLLERQAKHLENTANVVTKIEEMIERASEKGLDVSGLEEALKGYQASVAEAQAAHDSAAEVLRIHTGFDDDGNVTIVEEAARTVNQVRKSLTQAHRLLGKAGHILRHNIRLWINQQRSKNNAG